MIGLSITQPWRPAPATQKPSTSILTPTEARTVALQENALAQTGHRIIKTSLIGRIQKDSLGHREAYVYIQFLGQDGASVLNGSILIITDPRDALLFSDVLVPSDQFTIHKAITGMRAMARVVSLRPHPLDR